MASPNQDLKTLLAQGKLEAALETLVRRTEHADDADLRQRVLTLSGQFSQLKQQHLTGLLEDKDYRLQWNRIAASVADIAESQAVIGSHRLTTGMRWKKWAALLAVLVSIAGIQDTPCAICYGQNQNPRLSKRPPLNRPKKIRLLLLRRL